KEDSERLKAAFPARGCFVAQAELVAGASILDLTSRAPESPRVYQQQARCRAVRIVEICQADALELRSIVIVRQGIAPGLHADVWSHVRDARPVGPLRIAGSA